MTDTAAMVAAVARGLRLARPGRDYWAETQAWRMIVVTVADQLGEALHWSRPDWQTFIELCGWDYDRP